ncbi:MAG TPA: putative toxin-antitoxin system toxin component, PIN family [Smithellaceae bacterium]|nr:putative toxin-antitoxin system toxin component, PIN family [Smithellaceae bacterium]
MGTKETVKKPRIVLDTNCIVSALLFSKGSASWLADVWMHQRFIPLVSRETTTELMRVLSYPKFQLSQDEQEIILSDFLPYAEAVQVKNVPEKLPEIKDPNDLMFLKLAVAGKADALVSGDTHILAVKSQLGRISVLTMNEFAVWLKDYY